MREAFPRTRWSEMAVSKGGAAAYQRRFDDLAADGTDIHGEARFVAGLVGAPARILDGGCGTGRVATELSRLGYNCVGVDADAAMVMVARNRDPNTHFLRQDLRELYLRSQTFDVAILAGNVVPLLAPGSLSQVMERLAAHLHHGGQLVAGFGLDAAHLPEGCPPTNLLDYDRAATAVGFSLTQRWATWERATWDAHGGYAVSVHVRA